LSSTPFKYSCTMMPPAFFAEDYLIYLEMNSPAQMDDKVAYERISR
jgi:hypothetical protein